MNIHHASLFPDVIGASGYCNELISEFIEKQQKPVVYSGIINETVPAATESIVAAVSPPTKDFVIAETDDVIKQLILALVVDDSVKGKVSETRLKSVVKLTLEFVEEKAGVDWYERDSQLARLNIIVRRNLKKIQYPDDYIESAAQVFVTKVAGLSALKDREERLAKGSLIDLPPKDTFNFFKTSSEG
jgi:hypothetical protein